MKREMNAVDILRGARALIEKQWCQGYDTYGYCVITALGYSERRLNAPYAECQAARGALRIAIDAHLHCGIIFRWNDAPERTKEDVLAAYDRAITAAKEVA